MAMAGSDDEWDLGALATPACRPLRGVARFCLAPGADPAAAAVEPVEVPELVSGPEEDDAVVQAPIDDEYVPIRCVTLSISSVTRDRSCR